MRRTTLVGILAPGAAKNPHSTKYQTQPATGINDAASNQGERP